MSGKVAFESAGLPRSMRNRINWIMENADDPLMVIDLDGLIIACNESFCRLWSCSSQDIYQGNLPPALLESVPLILQNMRPGAVCQRLDLDIDDPDGSKSLDLFLLQQYDDPLCYLVAFCDITLQKQLLDNLQRSEEQFRLLIENAYDMITIIDISSNRYKYISPSHTKILGFAPEDLLDTPWLDHIHPDDLAHVADQFRLGLAEGSGSAVYRHLNKNGDYVWLHSIGYLIKETEYQGDVLLIARNIDQLKHIEDKLKESEEKYRLITDNSQDLIMLLDPVLLNYTFISPSIYRILGYQESEVLDTPFADYIHPDDLENVMMSIRKLTFKPKGDIIQYRLQRKDGTYLWAESIGKLFRNKEGKWNLLLSTRDISERKQVEQTLMASESLLRKSEKELKHQLDYVNYLISNMNEIFATYDHDQKITYVNYGPGKPLGYEPAELIGRPALSLVADSQKDKIAHQINTRLLTNGFDTFETILRHKDGSDVIVRIKSSSIVKKDKVSGAMLLIEDISEHRKLEREMIRLDQLNTVGEMAASLGHEIRNPMTTVQGFLQLMSQESELEPYQGYFNVMLEELKRANTIISEFLSLAKNKLVDLRPQCLNSLITSFHPLLQADALLSDKSLVLELQDIPPLLLDSAEIRQILVNLVRNGLDAMASGGKIYIRTYQAGPEVVLQVQDEGSGIDPSLLEKLGTPFVTTKESGTGLGLAICYSIVARHNAVIKPITCPQGTTIEIRFPIPSSVSAADCSKKPSVPCL